MSLNGCLMRHFTVKKLDTVTLKKSASSGNGLQKKNPTIIIILSLAFSLLLAFMLQLIRNGLR